MNTETHTTTLLLEFVHAAGIEEIVGGHEAIEAGWRQIQGDLNRIGMDASAAEARDTELADAVVDFESYPYLARLHASVDDLLTLTLPPEIQRWFQRVFSGPEPAAFEMMRTMIVERAANDEDPIRRSMWRVLVFEGIRLNLLVMRHWYPELAEVGVFPEDLSVISQQILDQWMAAQPAAPADVRPFHIIVAAAIGSLQEHAEYLRSTLWEMKREHLEYLQWRAQIDACLAKMDARDALLIRNAYATELEERPLTVDLLQSRHPMAFGDVSRDALDKRSSRVRERFEAGGLEALDRSKRGKSFVDILGEAARLDDHSVEGE